MTFARGSVLGQVLGHAEGPRFEPRQPQVTEVEVMGKTPSSMRPLEIYCPV